MAFQKEDVQTIAQLGLTSSQALVYLSLIHTGKATAKTISNCSKMARQEVYRVLAELHEKGLVEKIIATPTEFRAVPIEDCLNILIERKKRDISEIEKKATRLLQKLKKTEKNTLQEESQFVLLPEKGKYLQRARKLIALSQTSIDVVTTSKRFLSGMSFFDEEFKKALERGVKIRVIIDKDENEETLPNITKTLKALKQNPLLRVRHGCIPSKNILWIIDNKEVTIVTSARTDLEESPTLWTNNPVIRGIIQNYFETLWLSAIETNHIPPTNSEAATHKLARI